MRIFSNFDTRLRRETFETYKASYGAENVICFGRSRLYRTINIIIPFLSVVALTVFLFLFFDSWLGGDYFDYMIAIVIILDGMLLFPILGKYINYKMDFIIVIPTCVILYNQAGFLKRDEITINVQNIRAISIKKEGLLYSIFNNGDIIVLTEGDSNAVKDGGEIVLRWIPRPEKRKNQMVKIIGMDVEADQNPE